MSRYVLAPEAQKDLQEIRDYYVAEAGVEVARKLLRELRNALRFLARNPHIGHSRQDLTDKAVRFWAVRSYLVVYSPDTRPPEIIALLHGARDVQRILQRR